MRRAFMAVSVLIAGVAGLAPAAATADSGTTSATSPAPAVAPAPSGSVVVFLHENFNLGREQVTIPHREVLVEGIVRPYVSGQKVTMSVYLGKRLLHIYRVRIRRAAGGKYGRIKYPIASPAAGRVEVAVQHRATSRLGAFSGHDTFEALDANAGFGSSGPFVELVQHQLQKLHFYIPQTGVYDSGTGWAIDAYHRLLGWGTSQNLDSAIVNALLDGKGSFKVHDPGDGRHAEGNLSDQLLALINGSHVYWIFPISSGKPSTPTILGHFHIYYRVPGYLPDGMYYSDFFIGGYAIHGYDPAPDYPASHGCMRLPIQDAIPAFDWLAMGDTVDTYY
jgi:hypothetical protein